MEKEWSDKLFAIPDDIPATVFLSEPKHTVPILSAALADYCTMKGRLDYKRFMVFTRRVAGEVIAIAAIAIRKVITISRMSASYTKILATPTNQKQASFSKFHCLEGEPFSKFIQPPITRHICIIEQFYLILEDSKNNCCLDELFVES